MSEIVKKCPLCGSEKTTLFDQRYFREVQVVNRICDHCGLVFQSPRMNPEELQAFYTQAYRQLYQDSEGPNQKDLRVQKARAGVLLAFSRPYIESVTNHLDIGCSAGLLLSEFQMVYNNESRGVEPGKAYRVYAQNQGLQVYESLEDIPLHDDLSLQNQTSLNQHRFDLISLAHVLEHIPEPAEYIATIKEQYLTSDGFLLIEVPNLYSHDCFEVAHMVSFSPHTLRETLQSAGFEIITMKTHGEPRSEILPLYITILAKPIVQNADKQIQPESGVRFKRSVGLAKRQFKTRISPKRAWKRVPESIEYTLSD